MAHPDDEILSALIDGEASSDEAAHVEGCRACQDRLAALRHAASVVAAAVTLPPAHIRDASVSAAMRSADQPIRAAAITSFGRGIPGRTAARSAANRRMNTLSAAAALAVALAVGGWALSQVGGGNGERAGVTANAALGPNLSSTTNAAEFSTRSAAPADDGASAAGATAAGQLDSASGGATTDLGRVDDIGEVSARSTSDIRQREVTATQSTLARSALPCPPDSDEPVLWHASLDYQGTLAFATVRTHTSTTRITEIRSKADCSLLASQEFEPTNPR